MAPKRKMKETADAPAKAVTVSPRRTRSGAAGKRAAALKVVVPPVKKATAKKKIRFSDEKVDEKEVKADDGKTGAEEEKKNGEPKSVVIEACKQCNSFKIRAQKVKEGLEAAVSNITVTINPDKPRRGCFEVREEGGQVFISLLDMKRPFAPMKKLDMDEVINDIIQKIA